MRRVDLQEHRHSDVPYPLSTLERHQLRETCKIALDPAEKEGEYLLRPGSTVGAIEIGDLSVLIRPKIGIPQLLSLACYAMGVVKPSDLRPFDFQEDEALPDLLARNLSDAARQAFRRGLLHGYRTEEDTLYGIRGRIRFEDQLRRRFTVPMPVEVRYDEFTNDILANRLVKAAAIRLGGMRLRSEEARRGVAWVTGLLGDVSRVEYAPHQVPAISYDRLNEHYKLVVELARLILRHAEYQSQRGTIRSFGFLVDMNKLFEEFLTRALRESLGLSHRVFRKTHGSDGVTLDQLGKVRLKPDLSWWEGGRCTFVGDAKYKKTSDRAVPNADLYQLLAYVTALDLPGGMLIYAEGEADPFVHTVRNLGTRLEIASVDLSGTLDQTLARVEVLAERIKSWRDEARTLRPAA